MNENLPKPQANPTSERRLSEGAHNDGTPRPQANPTGLVKKGAPSSSSSDMTPRPQANPTGPKKADTHNGE